MVTVLIFLGSCCSPSLLGVVAFSHSCASSCRLRLLSGSVSALSTSLSFGFFSDLTLLPSVPVAGVHCFPAWSVFGSHPSVSWRFDLWVLTSLPWSWAFLSRWTVYYAWGFGGLSPFLLWGYQLVLLCVRWAVSGAWGFCPHALFLHAARGYLC